MSDANREIARRFVEDVWGKGDYEAEKQIIAADMKDHNLAPGSPDGLEGHHLMLMGVRAAFPDMKMTLNQVITDSDKVVDHWTCKGTHTGEFFGVPATGRSISFDGMDVALIRNGQISELWHVEDIAGLMQQLTVQG